MNTIIPHTLGISPSVSGNGTMSIGLGIYPDATSQLVYDNQGTAPSVGATLTGSTSGATGTVIGVSVLIGTGSRRVYLADVVGTYQNNENLVVGSTAVGDADGTAVAYDPSNNPPLVSMYLLDAAPNGATAGQKGDIAIVLAGNVAAMFFCDGGTTWRTFTVS